MLKFLHQACCIIPINNCIKIGCNLAELLAKQSGSFLDSVHYVHRGDFKTRCFNGCYGRRKCAYSTFRVISHLCAAKRNITRVSSPVDIART